MILQVAQESLTRTPAKSVHQRQMTVGPSWRVALTATVLLNTSARWLDEVALLCAALIPDMITLLMKLW